MITKPLITGAATLVAALAFAFGAGSLVRTLLAPAPEPVAFAALTLSDAPAPVATDAAPIALAPLAAVFGDPRAIPTPLPDEPFEPEPLLPEGQPWDDDVFFEDDFMLRGVIFGDGNSTAIVETPDGTQVVREGSVMLGGEEVLAIFPDGLELMVGNEIFIIGFDDDMMDMPGDGPFPDELDEDDVLR